MNEVISKEEFDKLMSIKGEVRKIGVKPYFEFIKKEIGEEGIKKLEETITKLGYRIKFSEMRSLRFYPVGLLGIVHLAIERLFGFDAKKFEEMGRFNARFSIILRILMKYLGSLEKAAKVVPKMWVRYYTEGELEIPDYSTDEKYARLVLKGHNLTPMHCEVLRGYFPAIVEMIVKKETTCEQTKCTFRGDDYHEFLLKW
jgi:hypothetical protein